ncbi:hypothetical protein JTB14_023524 [Gonioctena quinquepunctata]|nr:hypothetical protein JTB14_023524 [Gonioctena quinquepunctata]
MKTIPVLKLLEEIMDRKIISTEKKLLEEMKRALLTQKALIVKIVMKKYDTKRDWRSLPDDIDEDTEENFEQPDENRITLQKE